MIPIYAQDLHIHTVFSSGDGAVSREMTIDLVAGINHARIIGISDHFEYIAEENYKNYSETVNGFGFRLGTEVDGHKWVDPAMDYHFDYYVYHCWDNQKDYRALEKLMSKGKPVIIAHPYAIGTNLNSLPENSIIEINNRYIIRCDWRTYLKDSLNRFRFVLSSDAHKPSGLNLNVSRFVADELGIKEVILF